MPHPPLPRHAWRAALVLASGLSASCGDPKPPPTPDPPQVTLTVPEGIIADTVLKVIVTVSGCDTVKTLAINHQDTRLKTFPYSSGTVTLELAKGDIPYPAAGLAANLSLNAEAECDDGRKNRSQPQAATFLPVAKRVVDPQGTGQVVTDAFVIEGIGSNASFIGCGVLTTGVSVLYRVDANGRVQGEPKPMPVACNAETVITERFGSNGTRWVWTPGVGAFAMDSGLNVTSRTDSTLSPTMLSVMPDGDALMADSIGHVHRVSHDASGGIARVKWRFEAPEAVLIPPLARGDGMVLVASMSQNANVNLTDVIVSEINASDIPPQVDGRIFARSTFTLRTIPRSDPLPVAAFNADGSTLYLGFRLANNQSHVVACTANQNDCEGNRSTWVSPTLPAPLAKLAVHPFTSRVLAVGTQRVWALDGSGAIRNKDGKSVDANGALQVLQVLPGRPPSTEVFLLTAPARRSGEPAVLPQEIVAMDVSSTGDAREILRFEVATSLNAAVDDEGRLWMRTGFDLVQALSMGEYRRLKP